MIVVFGASGPVGRAAVEYLHASGARVRAVSRGSARGSEGRAVSRGLASGADARAGLRRPAGDRDAFPVGVELVRADLDDETSVRAVVAGATGVIVAGPHPRHHVVRSRIVDAAVEAGVTRLVLQSTLDAAVRPDSTSDVGRRARSTEEHLRSRGPAWTIVHPAPLMQDALEWALSSVRVGRMMLPLGTASVALVDAVDVGAVLAAAVLEDRRAGARYVVTGPEAVTGDDMAAVLSATLGRGLDYVPVPSLVAAAARSRRGIDPWLVEYERAVSRLLREGAASVVTSTVTDVSGRPARSFTEFVARHAVEVSMAA